MQHFSFHQSIQQLEKRKGGYFYLKINAKIVNQFAKGRATRLICTINEKISIPCGLNHFGDGNFFIIISSKNMKKLSVQPEEKVTYELIEDPNPLGVEVPEVLEALLAQDDKLLKQYEAFTDGRKRTLIYTINRIKNIDLKIERSLIFFKEERLKAIRKKK